MIKVKNIIIINQSMLSLNHVLSQFINQIFIQIKCALVDIIIFINFKIVSCITSYSKNFNTIHASTINPSLIYIIIVLLH